MAEAVAIPFLLSVIVSALLQPAKSFACWAFASSSICMVKGGMACPLATVLAIPEMGSCTHAA